MKSHAERQAILHGFTFPRNYRLTKTDEFSSVFDFRRAIKSSCFRLHYRLRIAGEEDVSRLGVILAKRLLRRSVDRNRIRRLAREQFRLLHRHLPTHDFVLRLMVRPDSLDKLVLAAEIRNLFMKMISSEQNK